MTAAFFILLAWCLLPLAAAILDYLVPVGWEDENGFHYLQATVRGTAGAHNPEERGATPRPATNSGQDVTPDLVANPAHGRVS